MLQGDNIHDIMPVQTTSRRVETVSSQDLLNFTTKAFSRSFIKWKKLTTSYPQTEGTESVVDGGWDERGIKKESTIKLKQWNFTL